MDAKLRSSRISPAMLVWFEVEQDTNISSVTLKMGWNMVFVELIAMPRNSWWEVADFRAKLRGFIALRSYNTECF